MMNASIPFVQNAPFVTADHRAERDAFLRLALGRRSRSHRARALARQAEADGNLRLFREWNADADDMWRKARRALEFARREADYPTATRN